MLKMCHMMHAFIDSNFVVGNIQKTVIEDNITLNFHETVEMYGSIFSKGTFVLIDYSQVEKQFGEVLNIVKDNERIKFEIQMYEELYFHSKFNAYKVKIIEGDKRWIYFENLPNFAPLFKYVSDDGSLNIIC